METTYVGIDYHKRYSVASAINEWGERLLEARIESNTPEGFARFFHSLRGEKHVAMEACWNWGRLYDLLEETPGVARVMLADPYKTRIIAEAQVKTDKIDARKLAELLRGGFIAGAHISSKASRRRKEVMRQRLFWVRQRTQLRNRVHALIDRQPANPLPQATDIFGKRCLQALRQWKLPEPYGLLMAQDLETLELLDRHIRQIEKGVAAERKSDRATELLYSLPGFGVTISEIVAAEIDGVQRFPSSDRLCSYAGLVPTTHSSGGKTWNGRMLTRCNKWLKWAFIEAAWVAVGCDGYFGALYRHHRQRGKKATRAITIVARRLCKIAWQLLAENRPYQQRHFSPFPGPLCIASGGPPR